MTSTADQLRAMIAKDFKIEPQRLTDDARLEDLGVDSIGMAEVIFNVEDEFGLKLPDMPTQLETFGDVVRYIEGEIATQRAAEPPTAESEPAAAAAAPTAPPPPPAA